MRHRPIVIMMVFIVLWVTSSCNMPPPPGSDEPNSSSGFPNDPTQVGVLPDETNNPVQSGPLKPVKFVNVGTQPYTVSPWTYTPPGGVEISAGPNPSTVASPGGNPSSYLSLSLGTYTWCYWWELGDVNNDKMIEYSHALDGRPVVLDETDSDTLEFAETVTLAAPTIAGDLPGKCDAANVAQAPKRSPLADGDLLLSDIGSGGAQGMFGPEYMTFGYAGGQAVLTANSNNLILPAMYNTMLPRDFSLDVDMTAFSAGGEGQFQIIFRSDDVAGGLAYYNIIGLIPGSRTIELGVWSEGWKSSAAAVIADQSISLNTPLHLRLEARGSEYVVFINGKFAAGFVDGSISSGGIVGMSITTGSAPGSFSYDNLQVHALP